MDQKPNSSPVIVKDLRACMDKHNRKDVMCALTSCRECRHADNLSAGHARVEEDEV